MYTTCWVKTAYLRRRAVLFLYTLGHTWTHSVCATGYSDAIGTIDGVEGPYVCCAPAEVLPPQRFSCGLRLVVQFPPLCTHVLPIGSVCAAVRCSWAVSLCHYWLAADESFSARILTICTLWHEYSPFVLFGMNFSDMSWRLWDFQQENSLLLQHDHHTE